MQSQMMNGPLLISALIEHAERYHCATSIASVETDGGIETESGGEVAGNARRLASTLTATGPEPEMAVIAEELPRNTAGKVPKQMLRDQFSAVPGARDD